MDFLIIFFTPFLLGILSFLSPCSFPLIPGYIGFLLRKKQGFLTNIILSISFTMGVLTTMFLLGITTAFFVHSISFFLPMLMSLLSFISGILIFLFGIIVFFEIKFPSKFFIKFSLISENIFSGGFIYGLLYGPLVFSCNFPLILSIFLYSITFIEFFNKILSFIFYGMGLSVPFILLSFSSEGIRRIITKKLIAKHILIQRISGLILIIVGLYILIYDILTFY
jgi:cytochrome c-type biogenesis protein